MPKWLIPLADDEGGNLFCYSIRNGEEGSSYYYNHEFDYGEDPEEHITLLSNSLADFMDALEEYDEE